MRVDIRFVRVENLAWFASKSIVSVMMVKAAVQSDNLLIVLKKAIF